MNLIGRVAILGAGLLGASLARAIKKYSVAREVVAWSRSDSTRCKCRLLPEVFDDVFNSPSDAVKNADLTVVCAPTKNIPAIVAEIAPFLKTDSLVTDVGSVKNSICNDAASALVGFNAQFVGSHPMAGSEKIGIDFSDADLFKNRPCFVTPIDDSQLCAAKLLYKFWNAVGMNVNFVTPKLHDAIVARVSHLPHLVAGTLCFNASKFQDGDLRSFSGPGFRDTTRVASGSPEMWDSIVAGNRHEIVAALKSFAADLNSLISFIENSDDKAVADRLRAAKAYRDRL